MENLLVSRLVTAFAIMILLTIGLLAFVYMKFPGNAVVAGLAAAVLIGLVWFVQKKEKTARFNAYYATAREFGAPVSFNKYDAAFERAGTRFDIEFPHGEDHTFFKVNFFIPKLYQKFLIQNRTLLTTFHDDCQLIEDSSLPPEYHVQSRDPEFLRGFLGNRQVHSEILNYNASFFGRILVSFDDGSFEMHWTPPISEQIDCFYRICQSAVVFHDELKKLAGK